ncbi:hypothetical protein HDU88_007316 [Geranomyces variabilis]|nr:hypothetical protein HDU88_007316 [Geranomyces variabilis]
MLRGFSAYFDDAPVLAVAGRSHPISFEYLPEPTTDYLHAAIARSIDGHRTKPPSDILTFLPGAADIDRGIAQKDGVQVGKYVALPLFAKSADQDEIHAETPNCRKIIVAANVADASITIEGAVYVIDSGLAKEASYDPTTRLASLITAPISRASAKQRAGRACRTAPGVLRFLGAINSEGTLTDDGQKLAGLPLDVHQIKVLVSSAQLGCSSEVLTRLAMVSIENPFLHSAKEDPEEQFLIKKARRSFAAPSGDHLTLLIIFNGFVEIPANAQDEDSERKVWCFNNKLNFWLMNRAEEERYNLAKAFENTLFKTPTSSSDPTLVVRALADGYFMQVQKLVKNASDHIKAKAKVEKSKLANVNRKALSRRKRELVFDTALTEGLDAHQKKGKATLSAKINAGDEETKKFLNAAFWSVEGVFQTAPGDELIDYSNLLDRIEEAFPISEGARALDLRTGGVDLNRMSNQLANDYSEEVEAKFGPICPDAATEFLETLFSEVGKMEVALWEQKMRNYPKPEDGLKQKVLQCEVHIILAEVL